MKSTLLRKNPYRGYRTARPSRLYPVIAPADDPARCTRINLQAFKLESPDYDPMSDGPPEEPSVLCLCTHLGYCRYQAVISPSLWHDFDPQTICTGYSAIFSGTHTNVVDAAPEPLFWWPEVPPSKPRETTPNSDELVAFAQKLVIGAEIRTLSETNPRSAKKAALRACKDWNNLRYILNAPQVKIKGDVVRLWQPEAETGREPPAVEMELDDFIGSYLTPPLVQMVLTL